MATTKKVVKITITLADGRSSSITLNAEPINDNLVDPDTGDEIYPDAARAILAVFESDDGVKAASTSFYVITTTTNPIIEDYVPNT